MIGRIQGSLLEKQAPQLLVDVHGMGYEVSVPLTTFFDLPDVGKTVMLHTHFVVREDAQLLYGFAQRIDRDLFRLLIKISGVGPKVALAILSGMNTAEFVSCVRIGDSARLVKLPGIGLKTAQRLLVEMKDRLEDGWTSDSVGLQQANVEVNLPLESAESEAESALMALGYKKGEAGKSITRAMKECGAEASSEALIRHALRGMAK